MASASRAVRSKLITQVEQELSAQAASLKTRLASARAAVAHDQQQLRIIEGRISRTRELADRRGEPTNMAEWLVFTRPSR